MNEATPSYTNIQHGPRIRYGLSNNDYCIAALIYHMSNNPKAPIKGWCMAGKETMGKYFGISRQSVHGIISKLENKGLIERQEQTGFLRTTAKWYDEFECLTHCKESLHPVKEVDKTCQESLHYKDNIIIVTNTTSSEAQSSAGETIPAPTKKSRKTNLKKLFKDSQFNDLKYTVEYFQGTELAQVNWKHYLPKIGGWSEKKNVKRDEQGWRDTIETWITKEINGNSLRTVRDIHPDNGTVENPKTLKGEAYFDYYGGLNPNFKQPEL
jgi:hypothetical protein